nr:transcriptional regulator [Aeromicrobium sp.]
MDEIDEAIAELLEADGRLTHREIAARVGLSRSATAVRVEHLIAHGQITVKGVIHPHVAGMHALAYVSLTVDGAAAEVAAAISRRFDVPFVSIVTGPRPVVLELRMADAAAIADLINELRALEQVTSVDTLTYVELVRDVAAPVGEVTVTIDATDAKILRLLQEDGRCSYAEIGRLLGMSPGGARRRVVRLLEGGVV